jgi:SsrA-binding protein
LAKKQDKALAVNRKVSFDYTIEDHFEAGIVLMGTEIKSLRAGKATLGESFATIRDGEAFVHNMHIAPYAQGNRYNPTDPARARKLLLHKREIMKLLGLTKQQGYTLVPMKLYVKNGYAKLLLGLAKGKKLYDKRQAAATKDAHRDMERALKQRQKTPW